MGNVVSRRQFLKLTGGAAAGAAGVSTDARAAASADAGGTVLPYKPKVIGKAGSLGPDHPVAFTFPDASSPCALLKLGTAVPGGVGPDQDIVAYSTMCTHMGCEVSYDSVQRVFRCPCHFSVFDAEKSGEMVCGQATENLPRIALKYNGADGSITALAVVGLLYGRQSNIL